jgi:serine/threonine-protein kinase PknG
MRLLAINTLKTCRVCKGRVEEAKCTKCGALYGNRAEEDYLRRQSADAAGNLSALLGLPEAPVLSEFSLGDAIEPEPVTIALLNNIGAGLRPQRRGKLATVLLRSSSPWVALPRGRSVDRMAQIKPYMTVPLSVRTCDNPACEGDPKDAIDPTTRRRPRAKLYKALPESGGVPNGFRLEEAPAKEGGTAKFIVRDHGFCSHCGKPFDFRPIAAKTMINDIRVEGAFASGADGFLYHGTDTSNNRPVVLKGRLNHKSPFAIKRALREFEMLTEMQGAQGALRVLGLRWYQNQPLILLGWGDGQSTFEIRQENNRPLPLEVGLSWLIDVMLVILHAHEHNPPIIYRDLAPWQVIVQPSGELIVLDWGAAIYAGSAAEDTIWTEGFTAPEMDPRNGAPYPTEAADVFGLGRLLCFWSLPFVITGKHRYTIPSPDEEPLFQQWEQVYRFVRQLTSVEPGNRMQLTAAIEQALALRDEVIALSHKRTLSPACPVFAPDHLKATELTWRTLPRLRIDLQDSAADQVARATCEADAHLQRRLLEEAWASQRDSREARLHLAILDIDSNNLPSALATLEELIAQDSFNARYVYERGRMALAAGDLETAWQCLEACYSAWPGTVGIKLALAHVAELQKKNARASRLFETAARVNPWLAAGPFGWARCCEREKDWRLAVAAYDLVPRTSWAFRSAQFAKMRAYLNLLSDAAAGAVGVEELLEAAELAAAVIEGDSGFESYRIKAALWIVAVKALRSGLKQDKSCLLLGVPLVARRLRQAAADALDKGKDLVADAVAREKLAEEATRLAPIRFFPRLWSI